MTDVLNQKRKRYPDTQAGKHNHVMRQQEGDHLSAKEGSLKGNQTCQHLPLGLLASRTMRRYLLLSMHSVVFGCGSPGKRTQHVLAQTVSPKILTTNTNNGK